MTDHIILQNYMLKSDKISCDKRQCKTDDRVFLRLCFLADDILKQTLQLDGDI